MTVGVFVGLRDFLPLDTLGDLTSDPDGEFNALGLGDLLDALLLTGDFDRLLDFLLGEAEVELRGLRTDLGSLVLGPDSVVRLDDRLTDDAGEEYRLAADPKESSNMAFSLSPGAVSG